jgi:dihydrofolate synthase / folylpolyglutamate synthase
VSYGEARAYLDSLGVDSMKSLIPSLHRMEAFMEALGHPEQAITAIHVTGTNGKTSTARIASSVLRAAGLKVATYTSPHLQGVRERLALGGAPLPEDEFGAVFDHIRPYIDFVEKEIEERLSYFEVLTGMFFLWAADAADVAVVEVGLGGRWDATNVLTNVPVAVITNIDLDHVAMLGRERTTIAKEKSGIIKHGTTVVTGELDPEILDVIDVEAQARAAPVAKIERDFRILDNTLAVGGRYLSLRTSGRDYEGLFLPLHGVHQARNAAVALEAAVTLLPDESLAEEVVQEGFAEVAVPGRLEVLRPEDEDAPPVVLDVAHNPTGMAAAVTSLTEAMPFDRAIVVIGILDDKDHRGMLAELARMPCTLIATEARNVRSVAPGEIEAVAGEVGLSCHVIPQIPAAVSAAVEEAGADDLVLVTGSHYVVGEARTFLTS